MLTFYVLAAALTLVACLSILLPFIRQEPGNRREARDIDVYREQLAEIGADRSRGLIGEREADEARAELGRRILRAADNRLERNAAPVAGRWPVLIAIAAIPLLSVGVYWVAGAPGLPDQPLAARLQGAPGESSIEELVARTERHLAANPDDAMGWDVLAPVYQRIGRHEDALNAWRRAIDLLGEDATRLSGMGEAIASAADGKVGPEAREWFDKALALTPGHEKSRFFLALALAQQGDLAGAAEGWNGLIADAPPDSSWSVVARQALAELERMQQAADQGPAEDDMAAVAEMPADERRQMIEGMVASLAERLEQEPRDPDGWERLIRSYIVLERRADAVAAMGRARTALTGDAAAMSRMEALARELDLAGG